MKLRALFVFIIMTVSLASNAQDSLAIDTIQSAEIYRPKLGVRVILGVNSLYSDHKELYDGGFSTGIGALYRVYLGRKGWFVEPGLSFNYDIWGIQQAGIRVSGLPPNCTEYCLSFHRFGLAIPLVGGYSANGRNGGVTYYAGFEAGIGLVCKLHETIETPDGKTRHTQSVYGKGGVYNRFNLACKGGVDIRFSRHFSIGAEWKMDLLNLSPNLHEHDNHVITTRIQVVDIIFGYYF